MSMKISEFSGEYRWLSNFWMTPIDFGTICFPSAEHAYQAAKSEDIGVWQYIAAIPTAGAAKKAGMKIKLRPNWDQFRIDAMNQILEIKFRDADLEAKLLNTGDAELIEGNYWGDSFWGYDYKRKIGINMLGLLLMRRRALLAGQAQRAAELQATIEERQKGFPGNVHKQPIGVSS